MEFESKILSKEILYRLYESGKTIGTAESCTSGRITKLLGTDFAIATTGYAGPGAAAGIPVGTIWIACGTADDIRTLKLEGDEGRDENLRNATHRALQFFLDYLCELFPEPADMDQIPKPEAK